MRRVALIGALALGTLAACHPTPKSRAVWAKNYDTRQQQLAMQGQLWLNAYEAKDWQALRALYADDAVLMSQGSPKIEGADNIIAFLKRIPDAGGTAVFTFVNEDVDSGSTLSEYGFVTARYRMVITMPGAASTTVAGRSFLVYRWQMGGWKLWRDVDNLAPDAGADSFSE